MLKTSTKKVFMLLLLVGMFTALGLSGAGEYLTFENLQRNKQILHDNVTSHYLLSVVLYMAVYITTTAFSIPGATILTLAGGFLFGAFECAAYVNVAATAGGTIAFLASRYVIGEWVQGRHRESLRRFNEDIQQNGHLYLLTLRFVPAFPFFLVNILAGITTIPLRTFIWTTSAGIIPGSLVYAYAGSRLYAIQSPGDILSGQVLAAFLLLGLFSLLPVVIKKRVKSKDKKLK